MNFRLKADMYVCVPKVQLAHYADNTMPKRDWSQYDRPTCERVKVRRAQQSMIYSIRRQAG